MSMNGSSLTGPQHPTTRSTDQIFTIQMQIYGMSIGLLIATGSRLQFSLDMQKEWCGSAKHIAGMEQNS